MDRIKTILQNLPDIQEALGEHDFPWNSLVRLSKEHSQLSHLHDVSAKINKKDKVALEGIEPTSMEYKRRELLVTQDSIQASLRAAQILGIEEEIQRLLEKLDCLLEEKGVVIICE